MTTDTKFSFVDSEYTQADGSAMKSLQGSCTDGTYVYALKTDGNDDETRVVRIDPKTWTVDMIGPIVNVGHANDLTYNPNTGYLYAIHMGTTYTLIDPSTLNAVSQKTLSKSFFSMAYSEIGDRYVVTKTGQSKYNFALMVYDGELKTCTSEFETVRLGYTAQGIFCDSHYIYYSQSGITNAAKNIITVYTWGGERVCLLYVDNVDEIESIFWYDGAFYAAFNGDAGTDYIAQLIVK
ncbi:MAG: hypothetical protein E7653_06365 [Ruminococcaceae bacterium]|nr:hypothetical protein [Oscillospiraceae bacterium]